VTPAAARLAAATRAATFAADPQATQALPVGPEPEERLEMTGVRSPRRFLRSLYSGRGLARNVKVSKRGGRFITAV